VKLAVAGKGGAGKTSIVGTLARVLARAGRRVAAIDDDSNPNLALTLGIPAARMGEVPTLPAELLDRTEGGARLTTTVSELLADHAVLGPDGVALLVAARPERAGVG